MALTTASLTANALTTCLRDAVTLDTKYALCVMNSGLFEITPNWDGTPTSWFSTNALTEALAALGIASDDKSVGMCKLLCTNPGIHASASCCAAATKVLECDTSKISARCRSIIEDSFALKKQCGVSSENIGLIVATCIFVVMVVALYLFSKVHARRHQSMELESRFATASLSRWNAILAAWRQVTNLVWKNLIIRRRKPFKFFIEQFMPVLLVSALVFIANLDAIFGSKDYTSLQNASNEASTQTGKIVCTDLKKLDDKEIGAPNQTMTTFYTSGQTVLGLFLLISYIKFVSTTTTTMVIEKETRIREVMKIMGLSDATLLTSWCLTSAILSTPLSFAIAAELKFGKVFPGAEYATLVFLFWSLSLSIVAFSYFITPFFNKSRTASIASVLAWIMLFFPFFSVQPKENETKYLAALSPPTAFGLAVDYLLRQAQLGTGLSYSIAVAQSPISVPTTFAMSWFLVLDAFILFALGWYLEQVLPQQYGVRKPWNFLLQKEYWRPNATKEFNMHSVATPQGHNTPRLGGSYSESNNVVMLGNTTHTDSPVKDASIEPVSTALMAQEHNGTCLQICGLRKVFPVEDGEEKIAVHHLNLTMYSGQITALLGHNGAGKTTTISMLTGLITPSSGDATLYGRSIRHDFNELRQIMGICPQHDVLFNDLTVEEHLQLFGTMKHVPPQKLSDEVTKMIQDVGLTEKRQVQSKNLSGGQKRKLCVAMAFIGDSKLVFLDEPTSGMDPYSRRFTWNLLQRNREDRVIVLTTHFMDEADILGDRVAIMADGQLCCAGSSLFLKNRYGAGYNLTIIKGPHCNVDRIAHFLRQFVPDPKCLSNYGSEVVFQLPSSSSSVFASMLQTLDGEMRQLDVLQYGMSVTTLEEVFLRIAKDREEGTLAFGGAEGAGRKTSSTSVGSRPTVPRLLPRQTFVPTFWSQYGALVTKRFRIAKRDKKSLLNSICIPLIFLIILLMLPEIDVANFLPGYTTKYVADSQLNNCTVPDYDLASFDRNDCTARFSYCSLGIIKCDASVCCDNESKKSPYFRCNMCTPKRYKCFNTQCLDKDGAKLQVTLNAFLTAMVVMLAFAFIPASIVAFIVREKNPIQNAKGLQLICGANVSAYWFSTWTHDSVISSVAVIVAVVVIPLSSQAFNHTEEVLGVIALIFSHALAMIPLAYLFSFRFSKHAVAQTSLLVFALTTGGLLSIFSFLCRIIDFELAKRGITLSVLDRNYLRWIFMLFPGYSLNNGIYEIATRKISRNSLFGSSSDEAPPASFFGLFEGLGKDTNCVHCWNQNLPGCCTRQVFDMEVAGAPVLYALVEAMVLTLLVFALENRSVVWKGSQDSRPRRESDEDEDEDVKNERRNVERSSPTENDSIFIRNLRQQYGNGGKIALHDLCLRVPKGECFGYLGINGAGKSTTMKILTGMIAPSSGFVTLGGYNLAHDRDKARTVIGYCPQFDSLHDLLTVKEQLELYARLKGIPSHLVSDAVEEKIQQVGLQEYRDKLTRGLSGGNKRKVSTAIALMGSPRIIFLDEPSTGVDPSSRRKMWDVIAGVCAQRESSVVLTTHSMEECEALCTRVGILVSGKLRCLGSVEHLKQKYGRGYTVEVKLRDPPSSRIDAMKQDVLATLGPNSTRITSENLMGLCVALGVEDRGHIILTGEGTGWTMNAYLESSGHIPLDIFCSWWILEDLSGALQAFFQDEFRGSKLVEHQGDHFRFQVPKHSIRPFMIFRLLEASKASLHVNEYGVSDTSLEHIFNNMAAQQDEERMLVSGMYDDDSDYDGNGTFLEPSSVQSIRSYHRSSSLRSNSFQQAVI